MKYKGTKNGSGVPQAIINQIPPHDWYCEAFAGTGVILGMKRPAIASVAIDIYPSCTDHIRKVSPGTVVINDDAISCLKDLVDNCGHIAGRRFVYLDPPYLKLDVDGAPVRSWQGDIYKHEFATVQEHLGLLRIIQKLDAMVMISGYWSKLYARELKGWRTVTFNSMTHSGKVREEWLWMNYPEPIELHEYTFLGRDRTDRQRIKRKIRRWQKKIEDMPMLEKRVIFLAMKNAVVRADENVSASDIPAA